MICFEKLAIDTLISYFYMILLLKNRIQNCGVVDLLKYNEDTTQGLIQ